MASKKVIKNIEAAINRVCKDIQNQKCGSGSDKLSSLSALINSYSRLLERDNQKKFDPNEDGTPGYHDEISKYKTNHVLYR